MLWLLQENILEAMQRNTVLTESQQLEAAAAIGGPRPDSTRVMSVANGIATINVTGVMTTSPNFFAFFFGGGNTLYGDIRAAALQAEADPEVTEVEFAFDSGGGEAKPVAAVGDVIAGMSKPTTAVVSQAASAAYWLASQCDRIEMVDRASDVGSIGTVVNMEKPSESRYVAITSSNAPNKRPDPETPEGIAAIREYLDSMQDLFSTAVAVGRDTTVEMVNNNFGQGGMLLAAKAIEVGMADGMYTAKKTTTATASAPAASKTKTEGAKIMDLATLKAEHPGVYAAVLAEGHEAGVAAEKDRVKFHALMGEKTGATAYALTAIKEGTAKDDTEAMVEYMTCGRNKSDLEARGKDENDIGDNNPAAQGEEAKRDAAVASMFATAGASLGYQPEA